MRLFIWAFILSVLFTHLADAQSHINRAHSDTAAILGLLFQKKLLLVPDEYSLNEIQHIPSMAPKISYDAQTGHWTAISQSYKQSHKRRYRKTNGCTIVTTLVVKVSDRSHKVVSRKKQKTLIPNFE